MAENRVVGPGGTRGIAAICAQPLTVGFALFFVWQNASLSFLFPSSAGQAVSPLFIGSLSVAFLLAFCVLSYHRDAGTFTPAWSIGLSFIATVAACVASVLVAQSLLPLWAIYVAAAVLGFSSASVMFVWATALSEVPPSEMLISVCCAFFLSSILDFLTMNSGYFTIPVLVVACGIGSWICYVLAVRAKSLDERPLLVRPSNTREFVKLGVGVALFAIALGIVAGTTADVATEESMRELNRNTVLVAIAVSFICFVAACIFRSRIEPISFIKIFAPCLVAVILLNIVDLERADIWLAVTIFSWTFLRLCVFLVLIEMGRHIVSLPMLFPAVWTVLWWGYAAGVFTGQNILPLAGGGTQALMNSVVLVAVLVVFGAVLLVGSRLASHAEKGAIGATSSTDQTPDQARDEQGEDSTDPATSPDGIPEGREPEAEPTEPLEERCARIAVKHQLSVRETEVFVYLAQGHTRASIAKKLFLSENTIREHVKNIYKKLYIHSRQQLIDLVDARR